MEEQKKLKVYAHRGAQQGAPENSFSALQLAADVGAKYIEFDVQLSIDQKLVIVHDETLSRVAKRPERVCDLPFAELTQVDIGSWFSPSFAQEKIPPFATWMEQVIDRGLIPNVELKGNNSSVHPREQYNPVLAEQVADYLARHWPAEREVRVSSFDFNLLRAIRAAGYAGELAVLASRYDPAHLTVLQELDACAYHINYQRIDATAIREVNEQGYEVLAYTINDLTAAKAFLAAGGCGFFTNNLLLLDEVGI